MKANTMKYFFLALGLLALTCGASSVQAENIDPTLAAKYQASLVKGACEDGGNWMRCYQLDPSQCDTVSGAIISACFDKIVRTRAEPVRNENEASSVSDSLVECIRTSFKGKYGANRIKSAECDSVY